MDTGFGCAMTNDATFLPPASDAHDVQPAARGIFERILLTRRSLCSPQPVIVLMGEDHTKPSHKLLHQAVMALCHQHGLSVSYHFEHEHNVAARLLRSRAGVALGPVQEERFAARDVQGALALKTTMLYEPFRYATRSYENLFGFCLDEGVRTVFIDAAKTPAVGLNGRKNLNLRDARTHQAAEQFLGRPCALTEEICAESPDGMAIRNQMMVAASLRDAAQNPRDVVAVHCGYHHLLGDQRDGFLYDTSLMALFSQQSDAVLAVFPQEDGCFSHHPPDAHVKGGLAKTLVARGLSQAGFMSGEEGEGAEIIDICAASGDLVSLHDVRSRFAQWRRELPHAVQGLLKKEL
ncbi:MAG: hypothetical protein WC043_08535 [Pseudobdellovibrionaceae bacterium]